MSIKKDLIAFENSHWLRGDQALVMRHILALPLVSKGPVLDVGGGDGIFADRILNTYGFFVRTLDISSVAVEKARAKGIAADIFDITERLPFTSRSFGTVCALDVLEHLYDPLSLLREMGRVGESVIVAVPNFHFIVGRISMLFGRIPFQSKPRRGHVYWFNYGILCAMVRDSGMRIESVSFGPIVRLGVVGRLLARHFPNIFADSFVVRIVPSHYA